LLVISIVDQRGRVQRNVLPIYDATLDDADGMMRLLTGNHESGQPTPDDPRQPDTCELSKADLAGPERTVASGFEDECLLAGGRGAVGVGQPGLRHAHPLGPET